MPNTAEHTTFGSHLDRISAEDQYHNSRGEIVDTGLNLFTDPDHGEAWRTWASEAIPIAIFRELRLVESEGSEDWLNVVEHSVFVAAAAVTLGNALQACGREVDIDRLKRAAIVHDASKRIDLEKRSTRESETHDDTLALTLALHGYSPDEIRIAKNTGRSPDRYIIDPTLRAHAIATNGIEANILGYCDARTRGSTIHTLSSAAEMSKAQKPKDEEFFTTYWEPYYRHVETYLFDGVDSFQPSDLTEQTMLQVVTADNEGGN